MPSQSSRALLSRATLLVAAALLGVTSAQAATYQWTGNSGVNQNYDNGANWVEASWAQWSDYVFNSNVVNGTVNINVFCGTDTLSLQSGLTRDITINGPVPLVFAGNWGHIGSISIAADSRDLTINTNINSSGEMTWNVGAGRTLTFSQGLSDWGTGPAALVKSGAGTAMLTGSSSYSGVTIFGGGVVNAATFANNGTASSLGVGTGDTAGDNIGLLFRGGVLQYTGSTAQTTDRAIRVSTTGGGATIDASGSVPSATLSFTRASMPNWWEEGGNRTLTLTGTNAGENTLVAGIMDLAAVTKINLTKSGVGTWVLAGAGNYVGVTNINAGTLIAASSGALGAGGLDGATMTWISNGATLALRGDISMNEHLHVLGTGVGGLGAIRNLAGTNALTMTIGLDGDTTIGVNAGTLTLTNAIYGDGALNASNLTKVGNSVLVLSGTNLYSGVTVFAGGVVQATTLADNGTASSLGVGTGDPGGDSIGLLFRGGALRYAGSMTQTTNRAIRLSTAGGGGTIDASGSVPSATLSFTRASMPNWWEAPGVRTLTLTGINTGENTLTAGINDLPGATTINVSKEGTGTWVLAGAGNYLGVTNINAGVLLVTNNTSLGIGGWSGATMTNVLDGATLALRGSISLDEHMHVWGAGVGGFGAIRSLSGNNSLTIGGNNGNGFALRSNTVVGVDADTLTVTGFYEEGGSFGLTKVGTGTLVFTANNAYTGVTTINRGTLQIGNGGGGSLAGSSSVVIAAGGRLVNATTNGNSLTLGALTLTGGELAATNTPAWNLGNYLLRGDVTVSGSVMSTISADVRVGFSENRLFTVADVDGGSGVDLLISGKISHYDFNSWGYATKDGAGTMKISGVNDIGRLTVNAGLLILEEEGISGLRDGGLINNATTDFSVVGTKTAGFAIAGSGSLGKSGIGTLVLTGNNPFSGGLTLNAGTLQAARNTLGSGAVVVNNGATLYANDQWVFCGINGYNEPSRNVASVTLNAGAVLYMDPTNGFANGITHFFLNGGSVTGGANDDTRGALFLFNGNEQITAGGGVVSTIGVSIGLNGNNSITVDAGSRLDLTNVLKRGAFDSAGRGGFVKNGGGTLVLSGANNYDGVTDITAGTLIAASNTALGAGGHSGETMSYIRDGATLALQGGVSLDEHFHVWGAGVGGLGAIRSLSGQNALTNSPGGGPGFALRSDTVVGVAADTLTVSGFYQDGGSFGLTKVGAGTLVLAAHSSYTGGTAVNAGTLKIGNGATGSLYSPGVSSGNLSFGSTGAIVNNGALVYAITGGSVYVNRTISGTGTVSVTGDQSVHFADGTTISTAGAQAYSATATGGRYYGFNLADNASVALSATGAISMTGMLGTANGHTGRLTINTSAGNGDVTLNTPVGVSGVDYGLAELTVNAGTGAITLGTHNGLTWGTVNAISLTGGAINATANLNSFNTLTVTNSADGTFSGSLSGSGSLTKAGNGTLTLTAHNGYAGGTNVNAGILNIDVQGNQGASALGVNKAVSVAAGATLRLNKTDGLGYYAANPSSLTIAGSMTTAAGIHSSIANFGLTLNGGTLTSEGAGDGQGNYILDGTVTTLANAAAAVISADSISLRNGSTANQAVVFDVADGAAATDLSVSSVLTNGSGTNGLTKTSNGVMVLTGNSSYSGATTVSAGTLKIGNGGATGSLYSPSVSWNGNLTFGGAGAIVNDGALIYDIAGGAVYVNRTISGLGTVSVTGDQSVHFADGTTISTIGAQAYSATATGGRYRGFNLADNASVAFTSAGAISMTGMLGTANGNTGRLFINTSAGNGDVTLNTTVGVSGVDYGLAELTVNAGAGAITLGTYNGQTWGTVNTLSLTGGAVNVTASLAAFSALTVTNSWDSTVSGSLTGAGSLTKAGIGTLTLTAHNSYTGGTNVNEGTLNIDAQGNQGASAVGVNKAVAVAAGATLRLNRTDGLGYFDANPSSLTIAGSMTIAAGIHASIANFGLTLNGGTLTSEGAGDGLGNYILDGTVTTLANASSAVISADSIKLRNGTTANQAVVFNVADGAAATDLSVSSVLANGFGTNGLTKTGNGVMVLTGSSSYSGATTVSAGTLILENTYAAGSHSVASGAALEFAVATGTRDSASTTFSGAGTLRKTGIGGVIWGAGTATFAFASGALIDIRDGTFTGGSWGNDNWGANLSDLNVESGALFNSVEANVRVNKITGSGTIKTGYNGAGYQNLTIGVDNGSSTFAGVIANAESTGNLVKTGAGTITLTGLNTYTGVTTVNGGTLKVTSLGTGSGGSALGNSALAPGNLRLNGPVTLEYAGTGEATARGFTVSGTGLTLSSTGSGAVKFTSAALVAFDADGNSARELKLSGTNIGDNTFAASLSSIPAEVDMIKLVTKAGVGTWILDGPSNRFRSDVRVEVTSGTLGLTAGAAGTADISLFAGATLRWEAGNTDDLASKLSLLPSNGPATEATVAITSGVVVFGHSLLSGSALTLVKAGVGTLELNAAQLGLSGVRVTGGRLTAKHNGSLGTGAAVIDGGTLSIAPGVSVANAINVNSGGTLAGNGTTGAVIVASAGVLSPGSSPGVLTHSSLSLVAGSIINWEVYDATGAAGVGYDRLVVDGTLDLTGASATNKITLKVTSLATLDTKGRPLNFDTPSDVASIRTFQFGRANQLALNSGENISDVFTFDLTQFTYTDGASSSADLWSINWDAGTKAITLTAIPEPSTYGISLGAMVFALAAVRRQRRQKKS
jgi:autotransporter-associated beta strand protein